MNWWIRMLKKRPCSQCRDVVSSWDVLWVLCSVEKVWSSQCSSASCNNHHAVPTWPTAVRSCLAAWPGSMEADQQVWGVSLGLVISHIDFSLLASHSENCLSFSDATDQLHTAWMATRMMEKMAFWTLSMFLHTWLPPVRLSPGSHPLPRVSLRTFITRGWRAGTGLKKKWSVPSEQANEGVWLHHNKVCRGPITTVTAGTRRPDWMVQTASLGSALTSRPAAGQ